MTQWIKIKRGDSKTAVTIRVTTERANKLRNYAKSEGESQAIIIQTLLDKDKGFKDTKPETEAHASIEEDNIN